MEKNERFKFVEGHILANKEAFYKTAYSYVKNKENALDILHDSIYKALKSVDTLQNKEYVKTWFYRILVNTAIDFLRKNKKLTVMEDEILEFHAEAVEDHYTDLDLEKALDLLPPPYRTIIVLKYFEDLTLTEIAHTLDENLSTIKTRLYSALKKLRVEMEMKEEHYE
ncbi:sigma-70 family RNA polymerase sigma factor [Alkaliphilus hydrothermalis]|uniref:RNA polymerase sigma-70 factor (ECF subfamily) n=1 Tax=Alkaliphilus hydrothermalis TaxID=1482730 RepID=A0ABS2NNF6_9FIRM|nr:sigma-70 family RNA polymerase sigma factor [Alkaliphilus hydrothermalis]MBM7614476.1 RNA polymerase sigma-70 factor (ECF subfamily) [Alkaliphilus hydrothermalis]